MKKSAMILQNSKIIHLTQILEFGTFDADRAATVIRVFFRFFTAFLGCISEAEVPINT